MENGIKAFVDIYGTLHVENPAWTTPPLDYEIDKFSLRCAEDSEGNKYLVVSKSEKKAGRIMGTNIGALVLDRTGTLHAIKEREELSLGQYRFGYDLYGLDPKKVETNSMSKKDEILFDDHEHGVLYSWEIFSEPKDVIDLVEDVFSEKCLFSDFSEEDEMTSYERSLSFMEDFMKRSDVYDMENGHSALMKKVWNIEAPQHKNYEAVKKVVDGFISEDMINELVCTDKLKVKTAVPYRRPNDFDKGHIPMTPLFCKLYVEKSSDGPVVTVSPYGMNKGMKRLSDYISPDGVFNKTKMYLDFQSMKPDKHPHVVNEKTEKTNQKGIK